ncbi:MAG: hypothetical protein P8Z67_08455 [Gammaproteobacteria bacterium]
MKPLRALTLAGLLLAAGAANAEEFNFDVGSYEKKAYQFTGFLEANLDHQVINRDSVASRLLFLNSTIPDTVTEKSAALELTGDIKHEHWHAWATYHGQTYSSELGSDHEGTFYEALAAYQPDPGVTLELGKKTMKWGKGYAWNPVGFVERPKDPNDPELAREGYTMATADLIKSYSGALKTLAFTPVYLPVRNSVNSDYGLPDHDNFAFKLYALYHDTDLDLMYLSQGSRSYRYGVDFSKNLATNFEVHGEWAYLSETSQQLVSSGGAITTTAHSAQQWLLGLRYLTENETTLIAEYYHNGAGYTSEQMQSYFSAVDTASASNNTTLLNSLASIGTKSYLIRNPGRDYLYVRVSNKEPFDWLYFTPALTLIANTQDHSYSLSPEMIYTGIQNLELRFKATLLQGGKYTEFDEKRNSQRYELRLRYFF